MTSLYPHEVVSRYLNKHLVKYHDIENELVVCMTMALVFSTGTTTILLLELPNSPTAFPYTVAGVVTTCFLALGVHIMVFEERAVP